MAHKLCRNTERFPAVGALVPLGLCVYAAVVLVRHQVGEFFLTGAAVVGSRFVAVLVVEQGAGVAVSTAALIANMRLVACVAAAALWRILVTGLHEGQVKPRTPPKVRTAARGSFQVPVVGVVRGFLGSSMMHL